MRARGEKNTLECSPAPRSDIENEWQLTWMPIFIRLTPGWQHSLYSPTQAVTSAISDPSHHLPPPLSLSLYPSLPSVHLRGSSSTGVIPCRTEHPGPCTRISGSLAAEPAGPLSASNETYIRLQVALAVRLETESRGNLFIFATRNEKICHLVKSQMYV